MLAVVTLPLAAVAAPAPALHERTGTNRRADIQQHMLGVSWFEAPRRPRAGVDRAAFAQSLKTTYTTTSKLYTLIATQMPVNNPGSLARSNTRRCWRTCSPRMATLRVALPSTLRISMRLHCCRIRIRARRSGR